ncbi:unnamed protein product [Diplocarpon coronariae]
MPASVKHTQSAPAADGCRSTGAVCPSQQSGLPTSYLAVREVSDRTSRPHNRRQQPTDMGPTSPLHVRLAYPPGRNGTPPVDASTLPHPSRDSSRRRQPTDSRLEGRRLARRGSWETTTTSALRAVEVGREGGWMGEVRASKLEWAAWARSRDAPERGRVGAARVVLVWPCDELLASVGLYILFLPAAAQALRPSQYREHDPPPQEMPRTSRPDAHARLPTSDVRRGNPPTIPAHGAAFHQPPPLDRRDLEELLPVLTSPSPARSAGSRRARAHAGRILAAGLKATHSPPLVDVAKLMSPISRCQCRVATAATARDVSGLLSPARISLSLDTAPVGAGVAAVSIHRQAAETSGNIPLPLPLPLPLRSAKSLGRSSARSYTFGPHAAVRSIASLGGDSGKSVPELARDKTPYASRDKLKRGIPCRPRSEQLKLCPSAKQ